MQDLQEPPPPGARRRRRPARRRRAVAREAPRARMQCTTQFAPAAAGVRALLLLQLLLLEMHWGAGAGVVCRK